MRHFARALPRGRKSQQAASSMYVRKPRFFTKDCGGFLQLPHLRVGARPRPLPSARNKSGNVVQKNREIAEACACNEALKFGTWREVESCSGRLLHPPAPTWQGQSSGNTGLAITGMAKVACCRNGVVTALIPTLKSNSSSYSLPEQQ